MPIIRVEMLPGRSEKQKRNLVKSLTDGFVQTCGGNSDGLHVIITEVDAGDWSSGGTLISDIIETQPSNDKMP